MGLPLAKFYEYLRIFGVETGRSSNGWSYKGTWNAAANVPELTDEEGADGDVYIAQYSGTTALGLNSSWLAGDLVLRQNGQWLRLPNFSEIHGYGFSMLAALPITLEAPFPQYMGVGFSTNGQHLVLPDMTTIPESDLGSSHIIYNSSPFAYPILADDETTVLVSSLMPGEYVALRCYNNYVGEGGANGFWDTTQINLTGQPTINPQIGTTYTLTASDFSGKQIVTANNASNSAYTMPLTSISKIPAGRYANIVNIGTGYLTLTAGPGDTMTGNVVVKPGACATVLKLSTDALTGANVYIVLGASALVPVNFDLFLPATAAATTYMVSSSLQEVNTLLALDYLAASGSGTITGKIDSTIITGANALTPGVSKTVASLTANNSNSVGQDLFITTSGINTNQYVNFRGVVYR